MEAPFCRSICHPEDHPVKLDPLGVEDLSTGTEEDGFLSWEGLFGCSCGAAYVEGPDGIILIAIRPRSPYADYQPEFKPVPLEVRLPIGVEPSDT